MYKIYFNDDLKKNNDNCENDNSVTHENNSSKKLNKNSVTHENKCCEEYKECENSERKILLIGGLGYIGSHVAAALCEKNYNVTIFDDASNSKEKNILKIREVCKKYVEFVKFDASDSDLLTKKMIEYGKFDAVIHLAAHKSVGESVSNPLKYYKNNLNLTISVLESMKKTKCDKLVFSSSCVIYGDPLYLPIDELHKKNPKNPYGQTKLMSEQIIDDFCKSEKNFKSISLRYFNPMGAHQSGIIGEDSVGEPSNLVPRICKVAKGEYPSLKIFGKDWDTCDGTGERDYIHVVDLAEGHVFALDKLFQLEDSINFCKYYNLGTGTAYSVEKITSMIEKISKSNVMREYQGRREGDISVCYADASLAEKELHWKTKKNIEEMCENAWKWENNLK